MNASLYVVSIRHQSAASFLDPEQVLRRVAQFPTSEKQPHTRLFSSLVRAGVRRDRDRKNPLLRQWLTRARLAQNRHNEWNVIAIDGTRYGQDPATAAVPPALPVVGGRDTGDQQLSRRIPVGSELQRQPANPSERQAPHQPLLHGYQAPSP